VAEFDQLQQALRQQLITLFQEHAAPQLSTGQGAAAAADPDALAFEPLGIPLPYSGFRLSDAAGTLSDQMANETLTALADAVPDVARGEYRRTLRSIASGYQQTLFALPVPGQAEPTIAAIERTRTDASALFERAKRTALGDLIDYRPITTIPAGWYDPAAPVWTPFSSSAVLGGTASVTTPKATIAAPAAAPTLSTAAWGWKVMQAADRVQLARELSTAQATSAAAPVASAHTVPSAPKAAISKSAASMVARSMVREQLQNEKATVFIKETFRPDVVVDKAPRPQPVEIKPASLEMKFEVCVVALIRPWMYWPWLDTRGWYMPGLRSGQLCVEGQPLNRVNVSAVMVRNLTLSAQGADTDELKDAVAFGPLQFFDRQVDMKANGSKFDVSIVCPTVQLIAWVTQPLSGLPPKTDPNVPEA
jgi:hypothetical protein